MADTQVLGTCVFGRAGSSPASRTQMGSRLASFSIRLLRSSTSCRTSTAPQIWSRFRSVNDEIMPEPLSLEMAL